MNDMNRPVLITVAPNGARKQKLDHPALPLTAQELGNTAAACLEAGASMLHLHVRDKALKHSLDPEIYRSAIKEIRQIAGPDLIIQITTEAVGLYQASEQMECVRKTRPEAVSLALRELIPAAEAEAEAAGFFQWLYKERVAPQYILYDLEDIKHLQSLCQRGLVPDEFIHVLLVLGRYSPDFQSNPDELTPLIAEMESNWIWSVCAFGKNESQCMSLAIEMGGHCRVGFENNLQLPDGSQAASNLDLVETTARRAEQSGLVVASPMQAREMLGMGAR